MPKNDFKGGFCHFLRCCVGVVLFLCKFALNQLITI